jgi:hypothetical protein
MDRAVRYSLIAIALAVIVGLLAGGQKTRKAGKPMIDQQVMELMKKLDTLDDRSRMQLLSEVDEQRNDLLGALLKQLGTSPSKQVQASAIYLIGRNRLADGVEELTRRIDFDPGTPVQRGPEPLWEKYPAMEALITIGQPSIKPVVELLATESNDLRRNLAVKVVRYVVGAETAEFILQRAQAASSDAGRRSRLDDALGRLRRLNQQTN